jgi:4-carboxymuconolactone decarboxylase
MSLGVSTVENTHEYLHGRRRHADFQPRKYHMSGTSDFGTWGRYTEIPLEKMTADQKTAYEFTMKNRGQVPGPYKIWLQNSKLMEVMVPLGAYYQGHSSLSKAEIEIATNLTNARWLAAYSNYEHERIAEKDGGLPPEKVEALIAGLPTHFDDPRQQVVYEVSSALLAPRVVPMGLYRRAVSLLGHKGLTDLTVLLGYFTCVSLSLMAYDVPSSAIGLQR